MQGSLRREADYLKGCMYYTQEGMHIEVLMLIEALTWLLREDERLKRQGKIWRHNIKKTGRGIESKCSLSKRKTQTSSH